MQSTLKCLSNGIYRGETISAQFTDTTKFTIVIPVAQRRFFSLSLYSFRCDMQALTRASQHSRERLRPVHWILVAKRETLSHKSIAYRSPIKTNSNTSTHRHICCWATFNRSIDFGSPFACIHILHRTNYNVTLMHTNKKILLLFIICNVVICRFICLWFGWLGWNDITGSYKFT